jgi:hypothetical protein
MLHAEILGVENNKSNAVDEKPSIYESVIKTHRTAIERPSFGKGEQIGLNVEREAMDQFIQNTEIDSLHKFGVGKIAIPVKLQMGEKYLNDPLMSRYEDPSFLTTKKEDKKPQEINVPKMPMISPNLQATSANDVKMIKKKLDKTKSKKEKLKACKIFV